MPIIVSPANNSLPIPYLPPILFNILNKSGPFIDLPFIFLASPLENSISSFFGSDGYLSGELQRILLSFDGSFQSSISEP